MMPGVFNEKPIFEKISKVKGKYFNVAKHSVDYTSLLKSKKNFLILETDSLLSLTCCIFSIVFDELKFLFFWIDTLLKTTLRIDVFLFLG